MMPECEYYMSKGNFQCDIFFYCKTSFNTVFLSSLKEAEKPFCDRLHRVRDLMERSKVSIEEVISELGQYLFIFDFILTFHRRFYEAFQ